MPDLLMELRSEEIPAKMQAKAAESLKCLAMDKLAEAGLAFSEIKAFATPCRLALAIEGLPEETASSETERRGPATTAPRKAIEGFARSAGVSESDLETRAEKKGDFYYARILTPGRKAGDILREAAPEIIKGVKWPKSMRWGDGAMRWIRPLHSIICCLTSGGKSQVVDFEIEGVAAGATTRGHKFMAPGEIEVTGFEDYRAKLEKAYVALSLPERSERILRGARELCEAQNMSLVEDMGLVNEIAGLVEWPVALMGDIRSDFLDLPAEVLRTSMKEHQKFLSVKNPATGKIEKFIVVANRETSDGGRTVLLGNQKVLSARLSDARFFWENDLRTVREGGLEKMAEALGSVMFHNRLGSQSERVERIASLSGRIAGELGADEAAARKAASVAKADLASEMVYEFPELQGIMGKYYARAQGLGDGIPEACAEHYAPLGMDDSVPSSLVSASVALADKADMLAGFWLIGEKPTGSKDPYALRRATLGIIRIMLESGLRLPLAGESGKEAGKGAPEGLLDMAFRGCKEGLEKNGASFSQEEVQAAKDDLTGFFSDRLAVHLREKGIRHDAVTACFQSSGAWDLALVVKRTEALASFLEKEEGINLLQGYKRAKNVLVAEQGKDGVEYSEEPDPGLAEAKEEARLFEALAPAEEKIRGEMAAERFEVAMECMSGLRKPIDEFFESVRVNAENPEIRKNRLRLLSKICGVCERVADMSHIEGV